MNFSSKNLIMYSKLERPSIHNNLVKRIRLENLLNRYLNKKLVLLSSPSGFGKSTVLIQWINEINKNVAWFSVDETDNNVISFLKYIIISIQININPNFGKQALEELNKENKDFGVILTLFINDFIHYPNYYLIFIDNYENITNEEVLIMLNFIINNITKNVTFFVSSKNKDLLLDLDKLRAKNQIIEITEEHLRFTTTEINDFFKINDINIKDEELHVISKKTEGWILSLQLVVFLAQKNININLPDDLDNKYIFDYIFNENLNKIDEKTLHFLLKTSLVSSFNYDLANTINKIDDSLKIINYLDKKNIFIINLDNKSNFFRYHNLFAELLNRKFELIFDKKTETNIRNLAANWYLKNNMLSEALQQLFILDRQDDILSILDRFLTEEYNINITDLKYLDKIPIEKIVKFEKVLFFYLHNLVESLNYSKLENICNYLEKENIIKNDYLYIYVLFFKANKIYLEQTNVEEAEFYIKKCIEISKKINNSFMLNVCNISLASILAKKLDTKNSLNVINNLLPYFKTNKSIELKIISNMLFTLLANNQLEEAKIKSEYILKNIEKIRYSYNYNKIRINSLITLLIINSHQNNDNQSVINELINYTNLTENLKLKTLLYNNLINIMINNQDIKNAESLIKNLVSYDNKSIEKDIIFLKLRLSLYTDIKKALELYQNLNITINTIETNYFFIIIHFYISTDNIDNANKMIDKFLNKHNDEDSIFYLTIIIFKAIILYKIDSNKNKYIYIDLLTKALMISQKSKIISIFSLFTLDINIVLNKILLEINKLNKKSKTSIINQKHFEDILKLSYKRINNISNTNNSDYFYKPKLTKRESEILELLSENMSNSEIIDKLCISNNTLKTHIKNIYSKLDVNDRESAVIRYQYTNKS